MKKFLLTLGVACMAMSSYASTRILYQQNFETVATAEEAGWSFGGTSQSIASDSFGKFLELSLGGSNGRSGTVKWGQEIYTDENGESVLGSDGVYSLKFDFCIANQPNNQWNSAFTVFTNHDGVTNQPYRNPWSPAGYWQNYLFDMSEVDKEALQYAVNGGTIETEGEDGTKSYAIDYAEPSVFEAGKWYTVSLEVNTLDREVEYEVFGLDGTPVKEGTLEVPETNVADGSEISMFAEGLWIMVSRYQSIYDIDNIMISIETEYPFANEPTIALTGVGQVDGEEDANARTYSITFVDGETLHVAGTDGQEYVMEYADCDGTFKYTTTTSGELAAWTVSEGVKSAEAKVQVDCTPIQVPAGVATISAVEAGFGKTYTLSVDNTEVPLRPTIFISYQVLDVNGNVVAEATDQASGVKVTMNEEGSIKIGTAAFGYAANETTVVNDSEFEIKKEWDFARMTKEDIKAVGFPDFSILNSTVTKGFDNWSSRKRLYYYDATQTSENESGETVYATVYPFGFIAEDNTTNVIEYSVIDNSAAEASEKGQYFEGLTIFPDKGKLSAGLPNVGIIYHVGLYNDQTDNNNNNIIVNDLEAGDFVSVNYINNYGGNSCHPVVETADEYYALLAGDNAVYSVAEAGVLNEETGKYDVTHALYRVDTACTNITVFQQKGGSGVEGVEAEVAGDNYYYSIDGIRVAEPTRPGLYIHNGKKIIVK